MGPEEYQPRRVETIDDVVALLASPKASFTELMECVAVSEASRDWKLRHAAAERAFLETRVEGPTAVFSLTTSAELIIDNYLKAAPSLSELGPEVAAANTWLRSHRLRLDTAGAADFADEKLKLLAELHVLLSSSEHEARVRLCSRLRKVDRSDLGIEAARPVANADNENVPALTTLGAAYCDMGEFIKAERVLRAALRLRRDDRTLVALSRVLQESGRPVEALDMAKTAFASKVSSHTAHRLLKAAAGQDPDAFDEALAEVEQAAAIDPEKQPDIYLLLLAAEALVDAGRVGEATRIVEAILGHGGSFRGPEARRFLRVKAVAAQQPSLFDPPLP